MPDNAPRSSWRIVVLLAAIAAITVAHYATPIEHWMLHNLYQRAYYVPVLLACAWFGLRGGLLAAIASAAAYAPHVVLHWRHSQAYQASQVLEIAMFGVVAIVAGALWDRERHLRKDAERAAEDLRRADRLAALGTLAAGMAHEVKNPLGAISGAAEILEQDFPAGHPRREFLDILREEIARLTGITDKYLGFARRSEPELAPLDLHAAIEQAVDLVSRTASARGVRFERELAGGRPEAVADRDQIHQTLVNVLLNAVHAVEGGGEVRISTSLEGGRIAVRVRDTGPGIPPGEEARIFEPFFTTRRGGTGLGLAVSRAIAVAHGGSLTARTVAEGGAEITLLLPRAKDAEGP